MFCRTTGPSSKGMTKTLDFLGISRILKVIRHFIVFVSICDSLGTHWTVGVEFQNSNCQL